MDAGCGMSCLSLAATIAYKLLTNIQSPKMSFGVLGFWVLFWPNRGPEKVAVFVLFLKIVRFIVIHAAWPDLFENQGFGLTEVGVRCGSHQARARPAPHDTRG